MMIDSTSRQTFIPEQVPAGSIYDTEKNQVVDWQQDKTEQSRPFLELKILEKCIEFEDLVKLGNQLYPFSPCLLDCCLRINAPAAPVEPVANKVDVLLVVNLASKTLGSQPYGVDFLNSILFIIDQLGAEDRLGIIIYGYCVIQVTKDVFGQEFVDMTPQNRKKLTQYLLKEDFGLAESPTADFIGALIAAAKCVLGLQGEKSTFPPPKMKRRAHMMVISDMHVADATDLQDHKDIKVWKKIAQSLPRLTISTFHVNCKCIPKRLISYEQSDVLIKLSHCTNGTHHYVEQSGDLISEIGYSLGQEVLGVALENVIVDFSMTKQRITEAFYDYFQVGGRDYVYCELFRTEMNSDDLALKNDVGNLVYGSHYDIPFRIALKVCGVINLWQNPVPKAAGDSVPVREESADNCMVCLDEGVKRQYRCMWTDPSKRGQVSTCLFALCSECGNAAGLKKLVRCPCCNLPATIYKQRIFDVVPDQKVMLLASVSVPSGEEGNQKVVYKGSVCTVSENQEDQIVIGERVRLYGVEGRPELDNCIAQVKSNVRNVRIPKLDIEKRILRNDVEKRVIVKLEKSEDEFSVRASDLKDIQGGALPNKFLRVKHASPDGDFEFVVPINFLTSTLANAHEFTSSYFFPDTVVVICENEADIPVGCRVDAFAAKDDLCYVTRKDNITEHVVPASVVPAACLYKVESSEERWLGKRLPIKIEVFHSRGSGVSDAGPPIIRADQALPPPREEDVLYYEMQHTREFVADNLGNPEPRDIRLQALERVTEAIVTGRIGSDRLQLGHMNRLLSNNGLGANTDLEKSHRSKSVALSYAHKLQHVTTLLEKSVSNTFYHPDSQIFRDIMHAAKTFITPERSFGSDDFHDCDDDVTF